MKIIIYTILIVVSLFVLVESTFAQVEPISPDRPDQTESPNVIPLKSFQFEAGFVFEKNSQNLSLIHI